MRTRLTFVFTDTEKDAAEICEKVNATQSRYMTKRHPAHFTPWESKDGKIKKFVVWYHTK